MSERCSGCQGKREYIELLEKQFIKKFKALDEKLRHAKEVIAFSPCRTGPDRMHIENCPRCKWLKGYKGEESE